MSANQVNQFNPEHILQCSHSLSSQRKGEIKRCIIRLQQWQNIQTCTKELSEGGHQHFWKNFAELSDLNHMNIVKLIGFIHSVPCYKFFIMPFASNGSVADYYRDRKDDPYCCGKACKWEQEMASGLGFLHAQGIIHGNLKSSQLLIFADDVLKISDAGLYKTAQEARVSASVASSSRYRYISPQLCEAQGQDYTVQESDDIFAFGRCMYLLHVMEEPFGKNVPIDVTQAVMKNNAFPEIPGTFCTKAKEVMIACWQRNPDERPKIKDIGFQLDKLGKHFSNSSIFMD